MEAKKNNFKKIMEEEELHFIPPQIVKKKLVSTISFLEFFGQTIELFVPKIVELFIAMTGGAVKQLSNTELPDLLEEGGDSDGDYDDTPGDPKLKG